MGHYGEAYPAEGEVGLLRLEGGAALQRELHEARHASLRLLLLDTAGRVLRLLGGFKREQRQEDLVWLGRHSFAAVSIVSLETAAFASAAAAASASAAVELPRRGAKASSTDQLCLAPSMKIIQISVISISVCEACKALLEL